MKKTLAILLSASLIAGGKYYVPQKNERVEENGKENKTYLKTHPLDGPVDINVRDADFVYFLSILSNEAGIPISLREVPDKPKITYFSLRKPLRVILDEITSAHDLWWELTTSGVLLYRYKSAVYKITFPLAKKDIKEDNQAAKLSFTLDRSYWTRVEESLKGLLSDRNSKVSVNDMGYVFVYARPSEMRAIEGAIERMQKDVVREVPLEIRVMIVDEDTFKEIGLDLSGRRGSLDGRSVTPSSPNPFLTLSLLSSALEMRLRTLAESGKVNLVESSRVVTLNGLPIVYAPQRTTRVVSSYKVAFIQGGQGQPLPTLDVRTEDIPEGSFLVIVPQYVGESKILFDLYYRLNRIESIQNLNLSLLPGSPPAAINLPQLSTYTNLAQTTLERGQSVVLFSGALSREEVIKRGIPFLKDLPVIGFLFGTHGKRVELFRLLIVITFGEAEEKRITENGTAGKNG